MNMKASCRSVVNTETLSLTWNVEGFTALRKLARVNELPFRNFIKSREFGNPKAGFWRVCLYPNGYSEAPGHVSLSLSSENKIERIAEYSAVILAKDGYDMPRSIRAPGFDLFIPGKNVPGWPQFLKVKNENDLKPYLVGGDCFQLKITVKVHCGVFQDELPRGILRIVEHRCHDDDDGSEDDDDDSVLPAENNDNQQSTVSSHKLPTSGGAPDASESSSLSLPSGVETTNDENISRCIVPDDSMQTDLSKFAVDPCTFDMTIICQGRKFRCNRLVLGARSEVFKAMLYGEFAESKKSEIEINDIEADSVEEFLTFLTTDICYSLKLPYRCRCEASKRSEAGTPDRSEASTAADSSKTENGISTRRVCSGNESCRYVRGKDAFYLTPRLFNLLAVADKYQVPELSSKCSEALARCICYRTVLDVLDLSETFKCDSLIDACWHYIDNCNRADRIVKDVRRREEGLLFLK